MTKLLDNLSLAYALAKREVEGKYKGSFGGILWLVAQTLLTLAIYSFVFGHIFRAQWAEAGHQTVSFTLAMFIGLLIFNLFSECVTRAPTLIVSNPTFVKKIVFPLDVLPVVTLLAALFNFCVGVGVLGVMSVVLDVPLHAQGLVTLPFVLLPFMALLLGLMWFLASFGTFVRDTPQVIGLITTAMMFLSPMFYPVERMPEYVRPWMYANPLTFPMEQVRRGLLHGLPVDVVGLIPFTIACCTVGVLGYVWFRATRRGFADVL